MDETQLVFVGRKPGSSSDQIAVLDFSRIEPFCQHKLTSDNLSPACLNMEVRDHFLRNHPELCTMKSVPFFQVVRKSKAVFFWKALAMSIWTFNIYMAIHLVIKRLKS
jgi:hypothetical protein